MHSIVILPPPSHSTPKEVIAQEYFGINYLLKQSQI